MKSNITVIIPTRNEIRHIERAVKSALKLTSHVYVIDSASTDGTIKKAIECGAKVFQYEWTASSTFSKKMNWAINELSLPTIWAVRLDADEYFMDDCIEHLNSIVNHLPDDVNGCALIRRVYFLGRWMKHSNEYPKTSMRVLRIQSSEYEDRWLDEHVDVKGGRAVILSLNIVDDSKITLMEWINKHNMYSNKEAIELINTEIGLFERDRVYENLDSNAKKKKRDKAKYANMPKYWRAFYFFCFRYFYKLGFLDGIQGFLWNFFQGWWYRTLCDAKVEEIYHYCGKDKKKIRQYIKDNYNLDITLFRED